MDCDSEINLGKTFGKLFSSICWGVGAMIIGGLLAGWVGATLSLCVMCYWRMCVITMATPLIVGLVKTIDKFEKKQTMNQALIQDLEELREKYNELREEFEVFQIDMQKNIEKSVKKQNKNIFSHPN